LTTRDTVAIETPAASATCLIVTFPCRAPPGSLAFTTELKHFPEPAWHHHTGAAVQSTG
jgi:hypothetical protein